MSGAGAAERALAFLRAVEDRASTRTEPSSFGTAVFNEALPFVYDRNFLRVERPPPVERFDELVAEADRLQGAAGLIHRRLVIDGGCAGYAGALSRRGFGPGALAVMQLVREPDREPPATAEEVDPDELIAVRREFLGSEPFGGDPETVRQLLANDALLIETARGRAFAAHEERCGGIAAWCRLYSDGQGVFQVEDVATLPAQRNRGLARAVVAAAVAAAERDAAELIFLTARDDDWPKELYAKLGFDTIGGRCEAVRLPGVG